MLLSYTCSLLVLVLLVLIEFSIFFPSFLCSILLLFIFSGCTKCEAGYYSISFGADNVGVASHCDTCEIGLYSAPGATTCTSLCPAGFGAAATSVPTNVNVFFMLDATDSICEQWEEEIEAAEDYLRAFKDNLNTGVNGINLNAGAIRWGNEPAYLRDGSTQTKLSSDLASLERAFTEAKSLTPE